METYFVTGSNRGIGWAMTQELVRRGQFVYAACRTPAKAEGLVRLAADHPNQVEVVKLEVTSMADIGAAAEQVEARRGALDVLINNAAILNDDDRFGSLDMEAMLPVFHVNTLAPVAIAQRFLPLLEQGNNPRLVNISSNMGSIAGASGGDISYSASKAALNLFTKAMSGTLKRQGVTAMVLDPGWVQTDMGSPSASLTPEQSARGVLDVVEGLTLADAGRYLRYNGSELPW